MGRIQLLKWLDRWLGASLVNIIPKPILRPVEEPRDILIIRPGGIGDAVLLAPTLQCLKTAHPLAGLDVIAESRNSQVFQMIREIRSVYRYDRLAEFRQVLVKPYDVIIDTEQWHRLSAVVCRLIRSRLKIGFATNDRNQMFTHSVDYDLDQYEVQSFLDLLKPLGVQNLIPDSLRTLDIPEAACQVADELLRPVQQPFLALFAGASIPEKRWAVKNFQDVLDWCLGEKLSVVLVGGVHDAAVNEQIASGRPVTNLAGRTNLAGTAAILERAVCVISGDSGVLHLAAVLNRPTVSLFGPSNMHKWAPRGSVHIALAKSLACSPCSRFGYTPPCHHQVRCLAELTPQQVCRAIAELCSRANK
jgi:ADP-heptose:LPS heptosyltransferase